MEIELNGADNGESVDLSRQQVSRALRYDSMPRCCSLAKTANSKRLDTPSFP